MRVAVLLILLLASTACPDEQTGPLEGDCFDGDRTCAGDQQYQECVDGLWSDPTTCPPEGNPPLEIPTYCNDGLCTP